MKVTIPDARRVPAVATMRVLSRTTGSLYLTGGLLVLLACLSYPIDSAHLWGARAIALYAVVSGIFVLAVGRRLPRWAYHVLVGIGTAIITLLVTMGRGGTASVGFAAPYVFVIIDASFFFAWPAMIAHLASVEVASWIVLKEMHVSTGVVLMQQLCMLVIAVIVSWLARVADAAEQDALTGLLNRRGFDRALDEAMRDGDPHGGRLSLVLLDLDNFKRVNYSLGHQAGDRLLVECATAWRAAVPETASLARYGGDEFALLLPQTGLGGAADLADRLRGLLPGGARSSAGVAAWQHEDTATTLAGRADVALYDAKSGGRDQTVVYGDPGRAASELEQAIAAGELELYYQPVVRLADGVMVSMEALARWHHPRRGLVPPVDFVAQAERTGAIHALGAWAVEAAGAAAVRWNAGRAPVTVAVNVSVEELRSPEYAAGLRAALSRSWLPPEHLVIEVTEAVFDAGDPQVARSLQLVRAMGVRIALDDFGTGYSSFRWLDRFPVDIVKVDASFVRSISDGARSPILEAILAVGQTLGLTVIAEGVETEQQARVLRDLGYELAQGYYFGRPEPLDLGRMPATPPA